MIRLLFLVLGVCLFGCGSTSKGRHDHDHHHHGEGKHEHATSMPASHPSSQPASMPKSRPLTMADAPYARPVHPKEVHFKNLKQLTFGGENAEAYFSPDGTKLIFQSTREPFDCDQIFTMDIDGKNQKMVSTGTGRTTCAFYFYPDDSQIVFSSTHEANASCPHKPDYSQGYVWPIYDSYQIYKANEDGSNLTALTNGKGYDAEATFAFDGSLIVFTSMRDGDLDIYTMKPDGSDVKRLTTTPGYDGGPFFSYDSKKIIYRAAHPTGEKLADYQRLLKQGLIRPSALEIFIMDIDGSNQTQITNNGAANFGPFMHPDGKRVIYSSNQHSENGREFDLFMVNIDGTGTEQITFTGDFDGFPMFSKDGKKFVFCSNRFNAKRGETNVFIADWVD